MTLERTSFTVFGANGLIGRNLCARLSAEGHQVVPVGRGDGPPCSSLGHVVYAIGLTADFRQRPFETIDAHVRILSEVLQQAEFDSFLYLSSTRVYGTASDTSEDCVIETRPGDPDHLYNLSKLAGESLTLHCGRRNTRVMRLSNVIDPDFASPNFLDTIVSDAVNRRRVVLQSHLQSSKDYIVLDDVINLLPKIATSGRQSVYNVAGGTAIPHREILDVLRKHAHCTVEVSGRHSPVRMPAINIDRVRTEFQFAPQSVLAALPQLIANLTRARCAA